ncbi:putative 6-phosphogluconolactonase [compost metagenome]
MLIANGAKKATIIKQTIEGEITPMVPSTIIQLHRSAVVMLDEEAAGDLIN